MNPIIVGSHALKYFGLNRLEPKDLDVWHSDCINSISVENTRTDAKVMPDYILAMVKTFPDADMSVATPDSIYTIKLSHAVYDIHWQKTKLDLLWLKAKGCQVLPELYTALIEHWKHVHDNKNRLSLARTKDEFFDDFVVKKYDHDWLHEMVAYPNVPIYTRVLKAGQEVLISKKKFDRLTPYEQVRLFKEEIAVIASERWITNGRFSGSWFVAYGKALHKTVVNLTKGWASRFIVENIEQFAMPDVTLFEHAYKIMELKMSDSEVAYKKILDLLAPDEDDSDRWYNVAEGGVAGIEVIAQDGGGEGGAEDCYAIIKFEGNFYKFEYYYRSHDGYYFSSVKDTFKQVFPKEKLVTVYE